jgi:hypothetical protein
MRKSTKVLKKRDIRKQRLLMEVRDGLTYLNGVNILQFYKNNTR